MLGAIGGYIPHRAGGIDWMAVITARMIGWKTESFREKSFFHYRRLGTAERNVLSSSVFLWRERLLHGRASVWELFRVAYRADEATLRHWRHGIRAGILLGYSSARAPRPVSPELMAFHRREQMAKLQAILRISGEVQANR